MVLPIKNVKIIEEKNENNYIARKLTSNSYYPILAYIGTDKELVYHILLKLAIKS